MPRPTHKFRLFFQICSVLRFALQREEILAPPSQLPVSALWTLSSASSWGRISLSLSWSHPCVVAGAQSRRSVFLDLLGVSISPHFRRRESLFLNPEAAAALRWKQKSVLA